MMGVALTRGHLLRYEVTGSIWVFEPLRRERGQTARPPDGTMSHK